MSTLTITIDLDNAAFTHVTNDEENGEPNREPEVIRLLGSFLDHLTAGIPLDDLSGLALRDINGSTVFRAVVSE